MECPLYFADLFHTGSRQREGRGEKNTIKSVGFVESKALLQQEGKYLRLHNGYAQQSNCVCMSQSGVLMIPTGEASLTLKRSAGF